MLFVLQGNIGIDPWNHEVFDRIRQIVLASQSEQCQPKWLLLGERVCLRAWKRLHGLGM